MSTHLLLVIHITESLWKNMHTISLIRGSKMHTMSAASLLGEACYIELKWIEKQSRYCNLDQQVIVKLLPSHLDGLTTPSNHVDK